MAASILVEDPGGLESGSFMVVARRKKKTKSKQQIEPAKSIGNHKDNILTIDATNAPLLQSEPVHVSALGVEHGILWEALLLEGLINNPTFELLAATEDDSALMFAKASGDVACVLDMTRGLLGMSRVRVVDWAKKNNVSPGVWDLLQYVRSRHRALLDMGLYAGSLRPLCDNTAANHMARLVVMKACASMLAVYQGHPTLGYRVIKSRQDVVLHPLSSLSFLTRPPQFIVALNHEGSQAVTIRYAMQVSKEEAETIYKDTHNGEDLNEALDRIIAPIHLNAFSLPFLKLLKNDIDGLKNKLQAACDGSYIIIETQDDDMKVYAQRRYHSQIIEMITQNGLGLGGDANRTQEIGFPGPRSGFRIVLGPGGEVANLLFPHQFRTLHIRELCSGLLSEQYIRDRLGRFGDIESIVMYMTSMPGKWGHVTFCQPQSVFEVISSGFQDIAMVLDIANPKEIQQGFTKSHDDEPFTKDIIQKLRISVCRRPFLSGKATVVMQSKRDYCRAGDTRRLMIKKTECALERHPRRDNCLLISGMKLWFSEDDVAHAFQSSLKIEPKEITLSRKPAFPATTEELHRFNTHLTHLLDTVIDAKRTCILPQRPDAEDIALTAEVFIEGQRAANSCMDVLCSGQYGGQPIQVQPVNGDGSFHITWRLKKRLHNALRKPLEQLRCLCVRNNATYTVKNDHAHVKVIVRSTDLRILSILDNNMSNILNHTEHRLTSKTTKWAGFSSTLLERLMEETNTFVALGDKRKTLKVFGPSNKLKESSEAVKKYLIGCVKPYVDLADEGFRSDIMFELYKTEMLTGIVNEANDFRNPTKLNVSHKRLYIDSALVNIDECVRGHCLKLYGNPDRPATTSDNQWDCQSCYMPLPEGDDWDSLGCCAARYCHECLRLLVTTSVESKQFPIRCVVCDEPVPLLKLQDLVGHFLTGDMAQLLVAALDPYVNRHMDELGYCHRPYCDGLVLKAPTAWLCGVCSVRQCPKCQQQYHKAISCQEFEEKKSIAEWFAGSTERKKCPKCGMGIEKIEGCNRVTCTACDVSICWVCLAHYPTSHEVYQHLNKVHGNIM